MSATPAPNPDMDLDLLPTFSAFMTSTDDCSLPCWWGLRPGDTTLAEITAFLQETNFDRSWHLWQSAMEPKFTLEQYIDEGLVFTLRFVSSEILMRSTFGLRFNPEGNVLYTTYIHFSHPYLWLPQELDRVSFRYVLTHMEASPEIFLGPLSTDADFRLHVYYPTEGVYIYYVFDFYDEETNIVKPCFSLEQTQIIRMTLSEPDNPEYIRSYEGFADYESNTFMGYFTDMSIEELIQFFSENPDGCLPSFVN
ncbi:MAG: hypothetical protein H7175_03580 [Burkholderiales bacterium]|nr:hypothetical protein [Anaerolineae bacterium]